MSQFDDRLRALTPAILTRLRRGIEKEGLRVQPDGKLASTPHPAELGSALTHPHITTDFSESQLELVTGAHTTVEDCLAELRQLHQFVYRHIGDEVMWGASMPCQLPSEKDIPLGRYGTSNVGIAKTVYRTGLSYRYGRRMQTISGLHYNFSLPKTAWPLPGLPGPNEGYFSLIRNFRRHVWLVQYLFGASPAVCATFVQGRPHQLQELTGGTRYLPHATSLRMGRLGYLSEAQDSLKVSHNDIETYTASLFDALTKPYPPYESIGIKINNEYRQLATSLLQIENEFYSTIRPKRVINSGERPLHALRERGVEYVEVRAMDLDPFSSIGIAADTARFLDVFLLWCLLRDSPRDTPQEIEAVGHNKQTTAARGRESGLKLERDEETVALGEWGAQILRDCAPIAAALDDAHGGSAYAQALDTATVSLANPQSLPSARMLAEMRTGYDNSYGHFAMALSQQHRKALQADPLSGELAAKLARMAETSLVEQRTMEAADTVPFETFRQRYLASESLIPGEHQAVSQS
ncbi:MAG: glutamate--cysteine ligase [Betaproteobacteria bacterium]